MDRPTRPLAIALSAFALVSLIPEKALAGLILPYQGTGNSSGSAFSIVQQGTGVGGDFSLNSLKGGVSALAGTVVKGTGYAARFEVQPRSNGSPAVLSLGHHRGTAGSFRLLNEANTSSALEVTTEGLGRAGYFWIQNTSSKSSVVHAVTAGKGRAGYFSITDGQNFSSALEARTSGKGPAAYFEVTNADSPLNGVEVKYKGKKYAFEVSAEGPKSNGARFVVTDATSLKPVLESTTAGRGTAGWFRVTNPQNIGSAISASTNGLGWAGSFGIGNVQNSKPAIAATTNGQGWAGEFIGTGAQSKGVYVSAPAGQAGLQVVGGTKNAVVRTSDGARALYSEEATEVWFSDYGFGKLDKGRARVPIDPAYAETVNLETSYHVFVQTYGDAHVYVTKRTPTGFEVRLRDGDPGVEFSFRIVAKRRGYEDARLERASWADDDPNLKSSSKSRLSGVVTPKGDQGRKVTERSRTEG